MLDRKSKRNQVLQRERPQIVMKRSREWPISIGIVQRCTSYGRCCVISQFHEYVILHTACIQSQSWAQNEGNGVPVHPSLINSMTMKVDVIVGRKSRRPRLKTEEESVVCKLAKSFLRVNFNGLYESTNPEMTKKICTIGRPEYSTRKKGSCSGDEATLSSSADRP